MVLSFFGKKPPPAQVATPAPTPVDQPPLTELSALDFTVTGSTDKPLDSRSQLVVEEVDGDSAAADEAAVLFANDEAEAAERVLLNVLEDPNSSAGEGLWMMLISLYRLTGQRERFEHWVLEYATRFLKSPPQWEDLSGRSEAMRQRAPLINLAGVLNDKLSGQLEQIRIVGRKSGQLRMDLSKLRAGDEEGCRLLLDTFRELSQDRVELTLFGCAQLADALQARVRVGERSERHTWLLLLALLQHLDDPERFEKLALDYAITFEESPPSWEGRRPAQAQAAASSDLLGLAHMDEGFCLEGDITAATMDPLRQLAALAAQTHTLNVDCSRLRRVDFVSAGNFFNILKTLQAQNRRVVLRNVNAMVAALLRIMGVDQVAQVMVRS